jgi:hypothetical protein
MALVTITGSTGSTTGTATATTGAVSEKLQTYVQIKNRWADEWITVPYLEAISATSCVAPNIPQATLLYRYGDIKREDSNSFNQYDPLSLINKYIRIMGVDGSGTRVLWVGNVSDESFNAHGKAADPQGDQYITAYGIEHLLDRLSIVGAMTDEGLIGWCPAFNGRGAYGGAMTGNSSGSGINTVFSRDNNLWSNYEIIRYLFKYFCTLPVTLGGQYSSLAFLHGVYNFEGLTIRQALDKLIDRKRGFGWFLDTTGEGYITLRVFSVYTTNIHVGTKIFAGNSDTQEIDLTGDIEVSSNTTRIAQATTYDKIIIQGARKKACFSVSVAGGGLSPAWTSADLSAYRAATEQDRTSQRFEHVFQKFTIPSSWNWRTDSGQSIIEGSDHPWNCPRPLLRWLPIEAEGGGETEYESPMVFVESEGQYSLIDKLPASGKPGAHVRTLDTDKGICLKCAANHVLGKDHIEFDEDDESRPAIEPQYDYETLHATVAIETDSKVSTSITTTTSSEIERSLVIDVHDAEYWYIAPGTITGVAGGAFTRSATRQIIRDDSEKLESIAALARSWYSADRASVSVEVQKIVNLAPLGSIVTQVTNSSHTIPANTAVTTRTWNFRESTTSLKTGFIDLDIRAMLDIPGMSDFRSVGRAFNRQQKELEEVKQRVGQMPSRFAVGGGGTSTKVVSIHSHIELNTYTARIVDSEGSTTEEEIEVKQVQIRGSIEIPTGTIAVAVNVGGNWLMQVPVWL